MYRNKLKPGIISPDKRAPRNPKYENVEATINSGMTVAKVKHMSSRKFLNRKNELFTRLTPSNLHELLLEYEHDACEDASTAARFGVGASDGGPRIVEHQAEAAPVYDRPYLLLDVRPYAEYRKCHLMQARSFPVLNLTQDVQTAELLQYKNKESTLIVIYDADGGEARAAGERMVERGFDNAFVLSGGLAVFADRYPSYVEGVPPDPPQQSPAKRTGRGGSSSSGASSYGGSQRGGGGGGGGGGGSAASRRGDVTARGPAPRGDRRDDPRDRRDPPRRDGEYDSRRPLAHSRTNRGGGYGGGRGESKYGGGGGGGGGGGSPGTEYDDVASRMSTVSVADSIISRATTRKKSGRY